MNLSDIDSDLDDSSSNYIAQVKNDIEDEVENVLNKMVNSISSRKYDNIETFFKYYADETTIFKKKSYLYDVNNNVVDKEEISLHIDDYVKYLFNTIKYNDEYSIAISIKKIGKLQEKIVAYIELRELGIKSLSKSGLYNYYNKYLKPYTDDSYTKELFENLNKDTREINRKEIPSRLHTISYSSCILDLRYDVSIFITGMSCIEKNSSNLKFT